MAKGSGGTRSKSPSSNVYSGHAFYGQNPAITIDEGYPLDKQRVILEELATLSDIYEIPIGEIRLINRANVREGALATTDFDKAVMAFGYNAPQSGSAGVSGRYVDGKWVSDTEGMRWVAAHEFGHLFPYTTKPTKPLMTEERAPGLWAKYRQTLARYNANKKINDAIYELYKEHKRENKKYGTRGEYAASSSREFVAEAFAYRMRRGAGHDEIYDKAYNLLLQLKR